MSMEDVTARVHYGKHSQCKIFREFLSQLNDNSTCTHRESREQHKIDKHTRTGYGFQGILQKYMKKTWQDNFMACSAARYLSQTSSDTKIVQKLTSANMLQQGLLPSIINLRKDCDVQCCNRWMHQDTKVSPCLLFQRPALYQQISPFHVFIVPKLQVQENMKRWSAIQTFVSQILKDRLMIKRRYSDPHVDISQFFTYSENQRTIARLEKATKEQQAKISTLQFRIQMNYKQRTQLQQRSDQQEKRLDELQHQINQLAVHQLSLDSHSHQPTCCGPYIWQITDVKRKMMNARSSLKPSIHSNVFYTSCGYKMCARMFLDGDGVGKGTHVSVFVAIMRGKYDYMLSWPFQQQILISLINQNGGEDKTMIIFPDRASSDFSPFEKPTSGVNIGVGFPQLVPIAFLEDDDYVEDDVMIIKIDTMSSRL